MRQLSPKTLIIGGIAAIVLAAAGVWFYLHNRDERLIRENLDVLAGIAAKPANETAVMNAAKLSRPDKVFLPEVKVEAPEYGMNRRFSDKDCAKALGFLHRSYKSISVELEVTSIDVQKDKAAVRLNVHLQSRGGNRPLPRLLHGEMEYQKLEGKWRVSAVKILPLLKK